MFDYLNSLLNQTVQWIDVPYFGPVDLVEIIILSVQIYLIQKSLLDTRIWSIVKGMIYLLIAYGVFMILNMQVLAQIFIFVIALCIIGIVLALQPDIKKMLEQAGGKNYLEEVIKLVKRKDKNVLLFQDNTINQLVDACVDMQSTKTGALIVIELDTPLDNITTTGVKIDAIVQKAMLVQSFVKNTPLHDGAMVIKGDRIVSATCYLPLTNNSKISKDLGTRHRAGIGVTEEVNCLVVIVSEETGAISWAENGKLRHKVQAKELRQKLTDIQHSKDQEYRKNKKSQSKKYGNTFKDKVKYIIEDKVESNLRDKILQALCAVLVWLAVINLINPVTTRRIQDLQVQVLNQQAITNTDKTYDILQGESVSIIVKGRRNIVDQLSSDQIQAYADLNNLSITNAVPIEIQLPEQYQDDIQIDYQSTYNMRIEVDDIAEVTIPVEYNLIGESRDNTFISDVVTDVQSIKISGPSKLIQTLDKVAIDIDVTDAYQDFQVTETAKVYDKNGQEIQLDRISLSKSSIKTDVKVLETKAVKINVNLVNNNSDIRVDSFELSNNYIQLAGTEESLNDINELNIEVDVTETLANTEQSKVVEVVDMNSYIDSDIQIQGDSKLNIQMQISKAQSKVIKLNQSNIVLDNMNSYYDYSVASQDIDVTVSAYPEVLDSISKSDIELHIDVGQYKLGQHDTSNIIVKTQSDVISNEVYMQDNLHIEVTRHESGE